MRRLTTIVVSSVFAIALTATPAGAASPNTGSLAIYTIANNRPLHYVSGKLSCVSGKDRYAAAFTTNTHGYARAAIPAPSGNAACTVKVTPPAGREVVGVNPVKLTVSAGKFTQTTFKFIKK